MIRRGRVRTLRPFPKPSREAFCIFEYIYFARPDSNLQGGNVYTFRKELGRLLAREHPAEADLVVPLLDSGSAAALGYAEETGIPYETAIIRNHFVGRTFIEPAQSIRNFGVKIKHNPIRGVLEGKRVVLVDDSIVRGTSMLKISNMMRAAGAREVHVRISAPPTIRPCHYGIDMPTREELIAANHSVDEIRRAIGADTLGYLSLESLRRASLQLEARALRRLLLGRLSGARSPKKAGCRSSRCSARRRTTRTTGARGDRAGPARAPAAARRGRVGRDRHGDHRAARSLRPPGRQAHHGPLLPRRGRRARHARVRLPAGLRHGDGSHARLRVHELGDGLRRPARRARPRDAAPRRLAAANRARAVRRRIAADARTGGGRAAQRARAPARARRRARAPPAHGQRARVLPVPRRLRGRAQQGLRRSSRTAAATSRTTTSSRAPSPSP